MGTGSSVSEFLPKNELDELVGKKFKIILDEGYLQNADTENVTHVSHVIIIIIYDFDTIEKVIYTYSDTLSNTFRNKFEKINEGIIKRIEFTVYRQAGIFEQTIDGSECYLEIEETEDIQSKFQHVCIESSNEFKVFNETTSGFDLIFSVGDSELELINTILDNRPIRTLSIP